MMNLKKYIGLAILPMVFTACQDDTLVENQAKGIYTLKATVDNNAPMSRAQVELGGTSTTSEKFHWNVGDALTVFEYDNAMPGVTEHTFDISADYDGSSASAEFTTTDALTASKKFTAIYPAMSSDNGTLTLQMDARFTLADNSESSWVDYFSKNMFMLATGTVAEGMSLEMQHMCSLLRVTYTNSTDQDVVLYSVAATGHLCGYRTFSASNVNESASDNGRYDIIGVSFENGLTVAPGATEDFYILVFSYFDKENYTWTGLNGFTFAYPNNVYLSTPTTYNGQEFNVPDLNPGSSYWFNITQTDGGLVWTKDASQGEEEEASVIFSNKEFSKALYAVLGADKVSFDADSCGVMTQADVNSVKQLDFYQRGLTSLEGLEKFVNLETFIAGDCYLSGSIKVTNSNLREFDVCNNDIASLDVSGLSQLEILNCSENSSLGNNINVEGTNLKNLKFHHTGASSLDFIPQNLIGQIENFDCGNNEFTSLDLSAYTSVKNIWISGNGLAELILPKTATLEILDMTYNPGIASVDLTSYPNLKEFYNQQNNLEFIDVSKCPELSLLFTNGNKLTELDLTNNPKIENLICGEQQDDRILTLKLPEALMDRWNNEWKDSFVNVVLGNESSEEVATITIENAELSVALQDLLGTDKVTINENGYAVMKEEDVLATTKLNFPWDQNLPSLSGIEYFKNLEEISCLRTGLIECDLSQNTSLVYVFIYYNEITELNLGQHPNLEGVYLSGCEKLENLNIQNSYNIYNLAVNETALTSLFIPNPEKIWGLEYGGTELSFDLNEFPNLIELGCENMNLNSLDFIPEAIKQKITNLKCSNNNLENIDFSEFPSLESLDCSENKLISLDFPDTLNLKYLNCQINEMENLDITSFVNLRNLFCGGQQGGLNLTLTLTEN